MDFLDFRSPGIFPKIGSGRMDAAMGTTPTPETKKDSPKDGRAVRRRRRSLAAGRRVSEWKH